MEKNKTANLPEVAKSSEVYMQADVIDQLNTNQQSNMTLCAYSVITQSCCTIKINRA